MSLSTAEMKKININKFSITTFYDYRARSSFCWKYFGNLVLCDLNKKTVLNSDHVYCAACLSAVKAECGNVTFGSVKIKNYSKSVSTGNLTRHLRDDHSIIDERPLAEKRKHKKKELFSTKRVAREGSSSKPMVILMNGELLARDIALWFCSGMLPFDSVCDEGMVDFLKKYEITIDQTQMPSRATVCGPALSYVYDCMLINVKDLIDADKPENFALSFDVWSDQRRQLNYITFGLRYLTNDFKLKTFTLSTHIINENNTVDLTENLIHEVLVEFGLDNKMVHAVTDAGGTLRQAILRGNMTHHLCLGYALHNLIVDGFSSVPEVTILIRKCKNIVRALRYRSGELEDDTVEVQQHFLAVIDSVAEMLEYDDNDPILRNHFAESEGHFTEGFQEVNILNTDSREINYIMPSQNTHSGIPTRWHCILEMLECIISICNREQMNNNLQRVEKNELKLTQYEWRLIEDLVQFLKRFREVVEIMTCSGSCNFNVALVFRTEIIDILNSMISNESMILITMKQNMLANVDRRFPVTPSMVAAALLDSRFIGLSIVDSYLSVQGMSKVSFLATYVREIIKGGIYVEDVKIEKKERVVETSVAAPPGKAPPSILTKLSLKHSNNLPLNMPNDPVELECWRYLASSAQPIDGNLLSYWNDRRQTFPWLSALARCLLCIPATCTPSERVFSSAGLVFSSKRLRLNPGRVNKIMFVHGNYRSCKYDSQSK